MIHSGKPGVIRTTITPVSAMIGIVLLWGTAGLAQQTVPMERSMEGFRELRWGTSTEQSSRIYQDLYFEKYVISDRKEEEPLKVYARRVEIGDIENVTFDSIEYWFRGDKLFRVKAELRSKTGPRTMVTQAENAFEKIDGRLKNRYGPPSDHKGDYVTDYFAVAREATWILDHSAVTIRYEGAWGNNDDLLTLIMQENTK